MTPNWSNQMMAKNTRQALAVGLSFILIVASSYGYQNTEAVPGTDAGGAYDAAPMSAGISCSDRAVPGRARCSDIGRRYVSRPGRDRRLLVPPKPAPDGNIAHAGRRQTIVGFEREALTEFPSVLANLAKNLIWTSSLGEAYHKQPSEVMAAIQTLRAKAKAVGNLKSTPQITVIEPTNPPVVSIIRYESALKANKFLLVAHGTAAEVAKAQDILKTTGPAEVNVHSNPEVEAPVPV
jgi:hypothetical protein